MSLTLEELKKMQCRSIMELDRRELSNAEDLVIDTTKSVESRIKAFMEQTRNPFAQNVGEYVLQIGYKPDTEERLEDRMLLLIKRKAQITL